MGQATVDEPGIKFSLELDNLYVGYGHKDILHGISLQVEQGTMVGIIGNSGAGKSTGVRCMTAQLKPSKGIAKTCGYSIEDDEEEVQLRIGYVPQLEYLSLYYKFSAIDNALFFGRNFGIQDGEIIRRCREVMETLGLGDEEFLTKPVGLLSGGERKRVSIMVGLINRPEVLFLDEPTTGLDPHLRIEVLNFLRRINLESNVTIIMVSHDLELADYCNKIMVFADGCMVDFGEPREMTDSLPNHGKVLTVQFESIQPFHEKRLEEMPEIIYLLHSGRNTYKIFFENKSKIATLKQKLKAMDLTIRREHFETCVFLDYFRVHSTYTYTDKAKSIIKQLNTKNQGKQP